VSTPVGTREGVIDAYVSAWGLSDASERLVRLEGCYAADAIYCDPTVSVSGRAALSEHIARTQAAFRGMTLVRTSRINAHGSFARFGWQMRGADGKNLPESLDVVEFGADGRIVRVIGFFGPLRPL